MWLTRGERGPLAIVGACALIGSGIVIWQRQGPPLAVVGTPGPVETAAWDAALGETRRVDVNTAGAAELERLPGVGPALAGRIVEHRARHGRFRTPEELSRVPGIGPKTLEALRAYLAVNE